MLSATKSSKTQICISKFEIINKKNEFSDSFPASMKSCEFKEGEDFEIFDLPFDFYQTIFKKTDKKLCIDYDKEKLSKLDICGSFITKLSEPEVYLDNGLDDKEKITPEESAPV